MRCTTSSLYINFELGIIAGLITIRVLLEGEPYLKFSGMQKEHFG